MLVPRRRRPGVSFGFSHGSVYEKPGTEATNGEIPSGLCEEECAEDRETGGLDHAECASVGVSTLDHCNTLVEEQRDEVEDTSITSPQEQRDTSVADFNHYPALSLARVKRSRSRQRAIELRNSAKVAKSRLKDDNNLGGYSGESIAIHSLQDDQPAELNLDNSNNICMVEDVEIGGSQNKEKGSTIYSTKRSGRQQSSLNAGSSSNVVREDGGILTDSIDPSIQQSNHGNPPAESIKHNQIGNENHSGTEAKVCDDRSKEKRSSNECRRITRSRSSAQQTNCVSDLFKLDGSSVNHKESGTSSLKQRAQLADRREEVKSTDITEGSCALKAKEGASWSNEHAVDGYSGRITRNRSSSQPSNTVYDMSKPVSFTPSQENLEVCAINKKHLKGNSVEEYVSRSTGSQATCDVDRIPEAVNFNIHGQIITDSTLSTSNRSHRVEGSQISAELSSLIREDQELCAANSTDFSDEENVVDECVEKNTRTSITEGTSKLVNSQDLVCRVTQSKSAASNKLSETKTLNSLEDLGPNKVSGVDVKDLPYTSTGKPADPEGCLATVKETEIDPDGQVESHRVCSKSNLDSAGFVDLELLAPCPADSSMLVEPRQLNFDNVEASSFNGVSPLSIIKDAEGRLLEKTPLALSDSAGILAKGMSENYHENLTLFLEEREASSKEREPEKGSSETCVEETDTAVIALNGHAVSAVKETLHAEKDTATPNLQQSDKSSKEKSSLRDHLVTLQVARESFPGTLLKEVTSSNISNVNAETGMNLSYEAEPGTPVTAIPAELVSVDSKLKTISYVHCKLSKDADFPLVTELGPVEIQDACTEPAGELPCSVSEDETRGNLAQSTENFRISQLCAAESLERSTHNATNEGLSQSTQQRPAAKSTSKTSFSASLSGPWTRNKRERSGFLDTLSSSPCRKENAVLPVNKDTVVRDLLSGKHSLEDVLESPDIQIPQDDVVQLVTSMSQVEEVHQSEVDNKQDGAESSLKLQVEEVFSFSNLS